MARETRAALRGNKKMGWGDIVALVGAAAWLPQIWQYFQKPKVTPIVGGQVEIGFSELGPVFNPKVAFRAERRTALVREIRYILTHERGQKSTFKCTQLVEYGARTESSSGETAAHQRQQDVVALVITPNLIVERKTNSREVGCLRQLEALNVGLARATDRARRPGTDWTDAIKMQPEYETLRRFLLDAFVWQAGTYTVECLVTVEGLSAPATCAFRFFLSEISVALLLKNLDILAENFHNGLLRGEGLYEGKLTPLNWFYPYALLDN